MWRSVMTLWRSCLKQISECETLDCATRTVLNFKLNGLNWGGNVWLLLIFNDQSIIYFLTCFFWWLVVWSSWLFVVVVVVLSCLQFRVVFQFQTCISFLSISWTVSEKLHPKIFLLQAELELGHESTSSFKCRVNHKPNGSKTVY